MNDKRASSLFGAATAPATSPGDRTPQTGVHSKGSPPPRTIHNTPYALVHASRSLPCKRVQGWLIWLVHPHNRRAEICKQTVRHALPTNGFAADSCRAAYYAETYTSHAHPAYFHDKKQSTLDHLPGSFQRKEREPTPPFPQLSILGVPFDSCSIYKAINESRRVY